LTTAFDGPSFALLPADLAGLAWQRPATLDLEAALLRREANESADLTMAPGRCDDTPTYIQPFKPHQWEDRCRYTTRCISCQIPNLTKDTQPQHHNAARKNDNKQTRNTRPTERFNRAMKLYDVGWLGLRQICEDRCRYTTIEHAACQAKANASKGDNVKAEQACKSEANKAKQKHVNN